MILKIALVFTILSIFGEYKGTQCLPNDEFNLICYVSVYANILDFVYRTSQALDPAAQDLLIKSLVFTSTKLLRFSGFWLNDLASDNSIVIGHANEMINHGIIFNHNEIEHLQTPKAKNIFEIIYSDDTVLHKAAILSETMRFCTSTLYYHTIGTTRFDEMLLGEFLMNAYHSLLSTSSKYGCVISLMNQEMILLIPIIDEALQSIYRGMMHILGTINVSNYQRQELIHDTENINVILLRMIFPLIHNTLNLFAYVHSVMYLQGDENGNLPPIRNYELQYNYATSINNLNSLLCFILGMESYNEHRLIKDQRIISSISGYYAVYNTSWENTYALDYNNNWDEDQRKVLLMELNAWASVLYERTHHMNDAFIFLGYNTGHSILLQIVQERNYINETYTTFFGNT